MLRSYAILVVLFLLTAQYSLAQGSFPDKCIGDWQGTLFIYKKGQLRDSVPVRLEIKAVTPPGTYQWKTTYLSENHPMVKDYTLVADSLDKNTYIMKETEDVELFMYRFDNKLYSLFETESTMLSSTYELKKDTLIFEVNSASMQATGPMVTSFNIDYLQKARFVREN